MGKTKPLLSVSGLTKTFGEHTVVDAFSLTLHPGKAVALVGHNGAGKSTILRCLVGAEEATAGTVELDGRPLDERDLQIRRDLAVVMDDLDFFPDLSVVEHLDLFAKAHGVSDADALVDEVLHEIKLIDQSGQLPGTLSSGQRRRLALASALVRPWRLLILDEPEQRLDAEGIAWLGDRLAAELAQGRSVLMACHDPGLVERVGARVVTVGK